MKVMVLGGGGQVARALAAAAPAGQTVMTMTRCEADITREDAIATSVAQFKPDWMVNAAAYTAVDRAQAEPQAAFAVNSDGAGNLARCAARYGCRLVHLSTDFVFDGQSNVAYCPADAPNPLNVYGASKLAGERQVLESGADAIVLRTAWVYASAGKNFVLTMLRLMRERPSVSVVCDQIGSPTWASGIARAIWELMAIGTPRGIYHWTDLGVASWYDFAVAIQDEALERGLLDRAVPILPIMTAEYPTPATRPVFSVLDTRAIRAILPSAARHWHHHLRTMLDELRAE